MIGRKSFIIFISNYLVHIIGLIGVIILAKFWGGFAPEALGIIGFAMSFLAVFAIISNLGFHQAHVKRISEGEDLGTCIGTFAAIKIFLTGLMVTVIFIAIFIWKYLLNGGFTDATTESIIHVFIIYYIFGSLSTIPLYTFVATREVVKNEIPQIFGRAVKVTLSIIVAVAGVSIVSIAPAFEWPIFLKPIQQFIASHAVGSLAMTYTFDMIIVFLVGMWFLRKYPVKKPSWKMIKNYISFALPLSVISVIGIISINISTIMIGYFWTSTEVGYFFTVQRILEFITILSGSVGALLFPALSELHSIKNFNTINQTTRLAERYVSMVMIPPVVIIMVFVYPLINIMLDRSFLPAALVLIILTIYAFISGIDMPFNSLIQGINKPGVTVKVGFVICATNIILNYLFIPEMGLLSSFGINGPSGAAVATVISISIGFILIRIYARKFTGIKLLQSHTPRHILAGMIMGFVLYLIAFQSLLFPAIHWYHLLMFAGLGLVIYLAVLFVLKEFKKQDLLFFLSIIHPKEMISYIKSELKDESYDKKK